MPFLLDSPPFLLESRKRWEEKIKQNSKGNWCLFKTKRHLSRPDVQRNNRGGVEQDENRMAKAKKKKKKQNVSSSLVIPDAVHLIVPLSLSPPPPTFLLFSFLDVTRPDKITNINTSVLFGKSLFLSLFLPVRFYPYREAKTTERV